MAKRKKRKSSGGGGAFGKRGGRGRRDRESFSRPESSAGMSPQPLGLAMREKDEFLAMMTRELAKQDFESPAEAEAYMREHFLGRPMDGLLVEHGRFDDSAEGRALKLIDGISLDTSSDQVRSAAQQALREDPDCVQAWMLLAQVQSTLQETVGVIENAVAAGRRKFAEIIETIDPDGEFGLWGHVEARPFLCAMEELAEKLAFLSPDASASIAVYEEILALNPGDNQGIRHKLVVEYLNAADWDKAAALLTRFADDRGCHFLYSSLFLELNKAWEKVDSKLADGASSPINQLPEEVLAVARSLVAEAAGKYPWAVGLLGDVRVRAMAPFDGYIYGGPSEAFDYARYGVTNWMGQPACLNWLVENLAAAEAKMVETLRRHHDDFLGLVDQLEAVPLTTEHSFVAKGVDERAEYWELVNSSSNASKAAREVLIGVGER